MRKRLVADRFRRVWALVEYIAQHPGCHRRELAQHFALSERQLQADLELIRREMGLPLVRRHGYRFQPRAAAALGLAELCLLGHILHQAVERGLAPSGAVRALAERLRDALPAHLRPLAHAALAQATGQPSDLARERTLAVLAQALAEARPVHVRYQPALRGPAWEALLDLEAVLPYADSLYLLGNCRLRRKTVLIELDAVLRAQLVEAPLTS
ncbi:MAG TPA: hypothetical protein VKZ60_16190 [Chloroflexota bacterium]|nr:hypothetical protein [Chloroflexota bacterium]